VLAAVCRLAVVWLPLFTMTQDNAVPKPLSSQLTHYEVLAVSRNASLEEIKAAHRQLALQRHPDKVGHSQEQDDSRFLLVQKAWECLRLPCSRQEYDKELSLKTRRLNSKLQAAFPLNLSDMEVAQDDESSHLIVYIHACRCGEEVQLWQEDVPCYNKTILSECPGCSFCFSITNNIK
jgi:hypothetical protein